MKLNSVKCPSCNGLIKKDANGFWVCDSCGSMFEEEKNIFHILHGVSNHINESKRIKAQKEAEKEERDFKLIICSFVMLIILIILLLVLA